MRYKAGDKVRIRSKEWYDEYKDKHGEVRGAFFDKERAKLCGSIQTIASGTILDSGIIIYAIETDYKFIGEEAIEGLVEEGTKSNIIEEAKTYWDSIKDAWICPDGYQFVDENGNVINAKKIVLEKKKKEYPKTYAECCKLLNIAVRDLDILDNMLDTPKIIYSKNLDRLLNSFRKLLICRDAYWKIAGEEMGLGKPWEPRVKEDCFVITRSYGEVILFESVGDCELFEFPTAEMRDAFYENFKELIEQCKELL